MRRRLRRIPWPPRWADLWAPGTQPLPVAWRRGRGAAPGRARAPRRGARGGRAGARAAAAPGRRGGRAGHWSGGGALRSARGAGQAVGRESSNAC